MHSLTAETFTRMSTPCKTQAEVPEQILAANTAPQVSAAEPTALGDQSSKTTALKPTPKIPKKPKQDRKSTRLNSSH